MDREGNMKEKKVGERRRGEEEEGGRGEEEEGGRGGRKRREEEEGGRGGRKRREEEEGGRGGRKRREEEEGGRGGRKRREEEEGGRGERKRREEEEGGRGGRKRREEGDEGRIGRGKEERASGKKGREEIKSVYQYYWMRTHKTTYTHSLRHHAQPTIYRLVYKMSILTQHILRCQAPVPSILLLRWLNDDIMIPSVWFSGAMVTDPLTR